MKLSQVLGQALRPPTRVANDIPAPSCKSSFISEPVDIPGPVGSIIYAGLYRSIKIKFTVLIRDTDQ